MNHKLALLFSVLQILSAVTAAPRPVEEVKAKVKFMAKQLLVRLDNVEVLVVLVYTDRIWSVSKSCSVFLTEPFYFLSLQYPPGVTLSPPFDDLDGLSSIVTVLEGYNSLISNTLDDVSLVKNDLNSLTGYLNKYRQEQGLCSQPRPKSPVSGPLLMLQSEKEFIHTVSIEACLRVKEYLNRLQNKLDLLKIC